MKVQRFIMRLFPQALRHQAQSRTSMVKVAARSLMAARQSSLPYAVCSTPLAEVAGVYWLKDGLTIATPKTERQKGNGKGT